MRTHTTLWLLAAFLTLTLVAAACGDDDPVDVGAADTSVDPDTSAAPDDTGDDTDDDHDDTDAGHDGDHDDIDSGHDGDHDDTDAAHADDHDTDHRDDDPPAQHEHGESIEVTGDVVPAVGIEVWSDPTGGVNVRALPTNFTIAPRSASTDHVDGEGHLHLYVDGDKVLRYYNECIHVPGVVEGQVDVAIELSSNDHRAYTVAGEPIGASLTFDVPAHGHDEHSHDEPTAVEWDGQATPTLAVEVVDDAKSGWNAFVDIGGFDVSCENASGDHVAGQGHLHIYANGEKLGRLYGPATHIAALPEGEVEISVAAYTNDHQPYVVAGEPVEASTSVTVSTG